MPFPISGSKHSAQYKCSASQRSLSVRHIQFVLLDLISCLCECWEESVWERANDFIPLDERNRNELLMSSNYNSELLIQQPKCNLLRPPRRLCHSKRANLNKAYQACQHIFSLESNAQQLLPRPAWRPRNSLLVYLLYFVCVANLGERNLIRAWEVLVLNCKHHAIATRKRERAISVLAGRSDKTPDAARLRRLVTRFRAKIFSDSVSFVWWKCEFKNLLDSR